MDILFHLGSRKILWLTCSTGQRIPRITVAIGKVVVDEFNNWL